MTYRLYNCVTQTLISKHQDRAWATGIVFNAGQTYSVGGGVLQLNGGEIMNFQTSAGQIVSGGSCFNGGGDVGFTGMVGSMNSRIKAQNV
jgi:hypothetical protein